MIQILPADSFGLGEIGSSSVTKAEDAGHENIDAAMYIRRDHPYFIVKLLKGRRNELVRILYPSLSFLLLTSINIGSLDIRTL